MLILESYLFLAKQILCPTRVLLFKFASVPPTHPDDYTLIYIFSYETKSCNYFLPTSPPGRLMMTNKRSAWECLDIQASLFILFGFSIPCKSPLTPPMYCNVIKQHCFIQEQIRIREALQSYINVHFFY